VTRAGFAAILGRPNVGKSTFLNQVVGSKVSITSPSPNTTRAQVRGILTNDDVQVIFVDTPGSTGPRRRSVAASTTPRARRPTGWTSYSP